MAESISNLHRELVRTVKWRDLLPMKPRQGMTECLHPLPWLAATLWLVPSPLWFLAPLCTFMFFLAALRVNHEAVHRNLGFSELGHRLILHGLSVIMLGSNHSVAFNHRLHHAHIGTARDLEGNCGDMSLPQVLLYGPVFPIECHRAALTGGDSETRRNVRIDLALNLVLPALAIILASPALAYHFAAMIFAQCCTALFAVWITHRGCHGDLLVARSQRSRIVNFLSYNMFFHLEHHLFPAVPVHRMPELARRLDQAAPKLAAKIKPVVGW